LEDTTVPSHPRACVHCLRASRTRSPPPVGWRELLRTTGERVVGFQDQALPAAHEWGVGSRRGAPSAERSVAGKYREVDSGARAQRVLGFELTHLLLLARLALQRSPESWAARKASIAFTPRVLLPGCEWGCAATGRGCAYVGSSSRLHETGAVRLELLLPARFTREGGAPSDLSCNCGVGGCGQRLSHGVPLSHSLSLSH
jgi:hypothetical protein